MTKVEAGATDWVAEPSEDPTAVATAAAAAATPTAAAAAAAPVSAAPAPASMMPTDDWGQGGVSYFKFTNKNIFCQYLRCLFISLLSKNFQVPGPGIELGTLHLSAQYSTTRKSSFFLYS